MPLKSDKLKDRLYNKLIDKNTSKDLHANNTNKLLQFSYI